MVFVLVSMRLHVHAFQAPRDLHIVTKMTRVAPGWRKADNRIEYSVHFVL